MGYMARTGSKSVHHPKETKISKSSIECGCSLLKVDEQVIYELSFRWCSIVKDSSLLVKPTGRMLPSRREESNRRKGCRTLSKKVMDPEEKKVQNNKQRASSLQKNANIQT
ncbi:hypothetical protein NPIL_242581 [Nephila pilipes]|uniref:Uncharacterized protein n=1 Tax=Nephila pilipes TaxID=299642 RepID=A0A8X6PYM1_NEPPI|nr:hypothetical protein NPIL_242581 [Nephila pilipes]